MQILLSLHLTLPYVTDCVCICSNNYFSVIRGTGMMMMDTTKRTTTKFGTTMTITTTTTTTTITTTTTTTTTITGAVTPTDYLPFVRHTGNIPLGSTILDSTIPIHPRRGGKVARRQSTIRPQSTINMHLPLLTPTPTASTRHPHGKVIATLDIRHRNLIRGKVTLTRRSRQRNQLQVPL